jgi:hypothetical protein
MNFATNDVSNPMTPDQSKAQVLDAARDIVGTLHVKIVNATFYRSSCNNQHEAPFRGVVSIDYPPAASFEESDAEVATMTQRVQSTGWTGDTEFSSTRPDRQRPIAPSPSRRRSPPSPRRAMLARPIGLRSRGPGCPCSLGCPRCPAGSTCLGPNNVLSHRHR